MNEDKAQLAATEAQTVLNVALGAERVQQVQHLIGGSHSQALSCKLDGCECVIRLRDDNQGFLLDQFVGENFAGQLPIPRALAIGHFGQGLFYCITERAKGHNLALSDDRCTKLSVLSNLFDVMDTIYSADMTGTNFGRLVNGRTFESWSQFILAIKDDYQWEKLYAETLLKPDVVERAIGKLEDLIVFLPEEHRLVHGDLADYNVICDGPKLTGLIDWEYAICGDPLYDMALSRAGQIRAGQI